MEKLLENKREPSEIKALFLQGPFTQSHPSDFPSPVIRVAFYFLKQVKNTFTKEIYALLLSR